MESIILQILEQLREGRVVDDRELMRIMHRALLRDPGRTEPYAKRKLVPYYQRVKASEPERWQSWGVTPELEHELLGIIKMKPRRTASGVATVTVITKPWPCSGACVFCPSDLRMPKSYLHDEPACARAEQSFLDPYLQVRLRLAALMQMGHDTGKVELIVLGGTWSDYPEEYQVWYVRELFRALNDADGAGSLDDAAYRERVRFYEDAGATQGEKDLAKSVRDLQESVTAGGLSYNEAIARLRARSNAVRNVEAIQHATWDELEREQRINEDAAHRSVGLVVETRPDRVTPEALALIRRLGATKIQMGVQSTDQRVLDQNGRCIKVERIAESFDLLRAFGFKVHAHAMANLLGSTPESDARDYRHLMEDPAFMPDEVKLYPCALIESSALMRNYRDGSWRPYSEDELLGLLAEDVATTPVFCRISRMIRDFCSEDIVAGNKKPNLRQLMGERAGTAAGEGNSMPRILEIRSREIALSDVDPSELVLDVVAYETANTSERFLQWVTPQNRIAGFLRLSLPHQDYVLAHAAELPVALGEAMIREVHVYGTVSRLGAATGTVQHLGLGQKLVERACELAFEAGYERINVISAVGTRNYYRRLGFEDHGLYLQRKL